jgi:hypothetical protein
MKKLFTLTFAAMLLSFASFALGPIGGASSTCVGNTNYVDDSLYPGGTWSSSNTAVATIAPYPPYAAMVTGVAAGTSTITYDMGGGVYVTMLFTVNPVPAPISGITKICVGGTSTFADATPGGVWSSGYTYVATIGSATGIQLGVNPGIVKIEYRLPTGCFAGIADTVVGGPTVDSVIHGAKSVCVGSTIGLSDLTSGGVWSSSNTSVATISSTGVVTGVTTGTSIISYTVTGACGSTSAHTTISVISTVSAGTITGTTTLMATTTAYLYDAVSGGTWSSSNTGVATISSTGLVTGVAAGTTVITYTVSGCGGSAYTTAVVTVTALDIISGTVSFTGAPYYGMVHVWLITFNTTTNDLEARDSTWAYCSTGTSVYYQFTGSPTDSYRVKADIYDSSTSIGTYGYIPTYHTSSYYWYAASVFHHTAGTSDINKDITMGSGTITGGPGFISGNVTLGANKGTGSTGAVGLRMYVLNSSGTVMQQTTTDASGNYTFSTLPIGTYTVFPEALNYRTTAYTSINITSSATVVTAADFIQHTISHAITPITEGIDILPSSSSSVLVFPNPSNGKVNMQWNAATTEKATVTLSDVTGRQVFSTTVNMNQGVGTTELDLSAMTNGLYIISVKSASLNYNNKLDIQK